MIKRRISQGIVRKDIDSIRKEVHQFAEKMLMEATPITTPIG